MAAKTIWALLDERQGNTSQTLGVAEALGVPFETKAIAFNAWVRLPNPLIYHSLLGVTPTSRAQLAPPWPDIVLSTARRLGLVASYIKHRHPAAFLAQIQWPGFPSAQFDLIAAPLHDGIAQGGNVITTLGAPHRVTPARLEQEAALWQPKFASLPSPRIAVLVGGGDPGQFAERHGEPLATLASQLALKESGSLLVTTSRRTGSAMAERLRRHFTCPFALHDWQDGMPARENPFYGFLGMADIVIATGDSVSMCSEACATGKPVYIYRSEDFMSAKHRAFAAELIARGHARDLRDWREKTTAPTQALLESELISTEIKKRAGFMGFSTP